MENLQVNQREKKTRHSSRQCRRKGLVPGVIYGKGINNFLFEIGELELNHALSVTGEHGLLSINSQEGSLNTLIKEVQRDPVTRRVLHIDLEKVEGNEEIETAVPINYVGEEYINKLDAVLNQIQLYSYLLPTVKIGNVIMDFREKYTLPDCKKKRGGRDEE